MARRQRLTIGAMLLCCGAWIAPAAAQTDFSKFPLAKAIPADVFVAVAGRHNPERKFLDDHWARVWKAVEESGIAGDVWEMIGDAMSEEQAEQVDQLTEQFSTLCEKIDWSDLCGQEVVHAGRYVAPVGGSPYEGVLLGRMSAEKATTNYKAFKAIMEECVKLVEAHHGEKVIAVTETTKDGFTMAVLGHTSAPGIGVAVGAWKDVIVFGFGGLGLMDDCVKLLKGDSKVKSLVSTERFKNAFAKLPPAEDEIFFFDFSNMLGQLKNMMTVLADHKSQQRHAAAKSAKKPAQKAESDDEEEDEDAQAKPAKKKSKSRDGDDSKPAGKKPKKVDTDDDADESSEDDESADEDGGEAFVAMLPKIFDEIHIMDYVASVQWTDKYSVHQETIAAMRADAKGKTLYETFSGGKPIANYERMVPKEAKNFSVGSGINWSRLYSGVREFYAANFPRGKKNLAEFDRMQSEDWELDIDKDILSLLSGGHVSVEMGDDYVLLIKVTDEEKADALLKRLFDFVADKAGKEGGLMITETEVAGHSNFRQISHPMMMMMGGLSPVIGCAEGYLVIGTKSKAVRICLETAGGKHPNITKNEQWRTQSVMPKSGTVDAISFEDQGASAEQWQAAIGGVSMAMGMAGMMGGEMPPEARAFLTKLPPIIAKLGPVAGKLDFFVSTGSYTTFENGVLHTREVHNYKGPRPPDEEDDAKVESDDKPMKKKEAAAPKKKPKEDDDEDE